VELRAIYQAPTEAEGLRNLDILEEKWTDRYPGRYILAYPLE
jgi:transposase-like protein